MSKRDEGESSKASSSPRLPPKDRGDMIEEMAAVQQRMLGSLLLSDQNT